mmetsp:Transcript_11244/g.19214  ORF Transcript_11244/g.19214 Transcript_11244/m.19214 type:complete len:575 (+) Transcript_11244:78-1802(+)
MLPPDSSFTLSLGGVEFRLTPEHNNDTANRSTNNDNNAAEVMSIKSVCNNEVLINLCNFNGTLRIATGSLSGIPVEDVDSPKMQQSTTDDISDDNTTPKGQKKLNFFGKKTTINSTIGNDSNSSSDQPEAESTPAKRNSSTEPESGKKKQRTSHFDEDIIEETKPEEVDSESAENQHESLTLATLGQTMVDELSRDSFVGESSCNSTADIGEESVAMKPTNITKAKDSTNKKEVAPSPRWGQTMTMITDTKFIVYGGQTFDPTDDSAKPLSDLFVYDLLENKWSKPINCDGVARTWHTANFLPQRQLLLCFGGDVEDEKTGKMSSTDQVMVLDCEIMLWYPPTVSGQIPSGRSGHSASVFEDTSELVVFGGVKNGKWLNSASVLDTNRWRWSTIRAIGVAPPHRSYHSSTAIKTDDSTRLVIFGGNDDSKCFNTVHLLERVGNGKFAWSHPKCSGDLPKPRTGHTATLLSDGHTILIYGGWDPNTEDENSDEDLVFGDSFLLDTKTWTWSKGPNPRFGATNQSGKSAATNGGRSRVGHSAVLAPCSSDGLQVLCFGGRLPDNEFANDFQSLSAM